jgi:hypothetical protein
MSKDTQATLLKQLKNPFDAKFVKWRVGATNADKTSGIALAYIDSREVMKRLDEVCGIGNWRDHLSPVDNGFICEIDIKIDGEWITRSNAAGYTHVEPVKGGASDAFKRAASTWGVGRYLYYLPNIWVAIKPYGKSYVLAEQPELPGWAKHDANIENWEDVAEMELEASASADEQEIAGVIIGHLNDVRRAESTEELQKIMALLTPDEQNILAPEINTRTKELLSRVGTPS